MIFVVALFCFSLASPVLAAEGDTSSSESPSASEPLKVELTLVSDDSAGVTPYVSGEEIVVGAEVLDLILTALGQIEENTQDDVSFHAPATSVSSDLILPPEGDRSGLAGAMSSIFGEYTPLTYQVDTYLDDVLIDSGIEVVPGLAGLDWSWLGGVFLFSIMLFCFFKLLGGVWCK